MLALLRRWGITLLLEVQLIRTLMEDESEEPSLRRWAYEHFGTTTKPDGSLVLTSIKGDDIPLSLCLGSFVVIAYSIEVLWR